MQRVPVPGDHLRASRGLYSHHGIYVGHGYVVHFTGAKRDLAAATIRYDLVEAFRADGAVEIVEYVKAHGVEMVLQRALSRIGESGYHLFANNCEHFARWCKTGEAFSEQVSRAGAATGGISGGVGLTAAAIGVVSTTGAVAGLGGSGVMSGLAAAGLGTGAVGGLGILAAAPAAAATVALHRAFRDDPYLPRSERIARRNGRAGSLFGAAVGTVGAIGAVSASGAVVGLSAAGISSGLAAIGGSMVGGVVVAIAAPAAVGAVFSYAIYRLSRGRTA